MATNLKSTHGDNFSQIGGKNMTRIVVTGTKAEIMTKLNTVTANDWSFVDLVGKNDGMILLVARDDSAFWATLFGAT